MLGKQIVQQDEEPLKQLVRVLEIAELENNEPFAEYTYQLKDLRYRITMKLPQKNHYQNVNGSGNGNSNKQRY